MDEVTRLPHAMLGVFYIVFVCLCLCVCVCVCVCVLVFFVVCEWMFEKRYMPNWTEVVFTIDGIQHTNSITYKLKDLNNEPINESFYEQELKKTMCRKCLRKSFIGTRKRS